MYWVKHKIIEIFKFNRYLIAVGLESGEVLLYTWKLTDKGSNSGWIQIIHLDQQYPFLGD